MQLETLWGVVPSTGERVACGDDALMRAIMNATEQINKNEGEQKMGQKSEYIIGLVAEEIHFPETVVAALKNFKRNHKYNSPLPFEQATQARFEAMKDMVRIFSAAYGIEPIELRMSNITSNGDSSRSYYNDDENERYVLLTGKLSIITFLHEFGHVLGFDEEQARKWSLTLFKKVYPIAFDRLCMGQQGENAFYLVTEAHLNRHTTQLEAGAPITPSAEQQAVMEQVATEQPAIEEPAS